MNEWDLWFAIVNRNRNFAKSEFREHKKPIFQMRESNDEKSHQNVWFRVLFEGMDYPKQWDKLANILNQQSNEEEQIISGFNDGLDI